MNRERLLRDLHCLLAGQSHLGLARVDCDIGCFSSPPSRAIEQRDPSQPERPAGVAAVPGAEGLGRLRELIGECTRCPLHRGRTQIVFGAGDPDARLMFIGEGPGRDEDLRGEPFVGRAGQLLTRMIVAMGLCRNEVYIANIVKCRPPRNRDPEPEEVAACEPFLKAQIRAVQPEVIVALGKYAAQTLLGSQVAVSRLRGRWARYAGIPLMPTFHPAYLLRNPAEKRAVWQDLQEVMGVLGLRGREG